MLFIVRRPVDLIGEDLLQCSGERTVARRRIELVAAPQPTARRTGLPTRLSMSTNVSIVNLAVYWFTTSDTRGRDTIRFAPRPPA